MPHCEVLREKETIFIILLLLNPRIRIFRSSFARFDDHTQVYSVWMNYIYRHTHTHNFVCSFHWVGIFVSRFCWQKWRHARGCHYRFISWHTKILQSANRRWFWQKHNAHFLNSTYIKHLLIACVLQSSSFEPKKKHIHNSGCIYEMMHDFILHRVSYAELLINEINEI